MDREKVIKHITAEIERICKKDFPSVEIDMLSDSDTLAIPKEQETIVRCRDCKYCNKDDYVCEHPNEWGNEDTRNQCNLNWFCADGERADT